MNDLLFAAALPWILYFSVVFLLHLAYILLDCFFPDEIIKHRKDTKE